MTNTRFAFILVLVTLSLHAATAQAGKLYRWIDEKGEVQFSDSLPPDQSKSAHDELSKQGVTVHKVDKAKTKEQLEAEQQQKAVAEQQKAEAERVRKEELARERMLLDTYISENDIVSMRDRNISTVEGAIKIAEASMTAVKTTLDSLKTDLAASGKDLARQQKLQKHIGEAEQQIERFTAFIQTKRQEQATIKQKYDDDLLRFREVRARSGTETTATAK